jgi:hypothetical protein
MDVPQRVLEDRLGDLAVLPGAQTGEQRVGGVQALGVLGRRDDSEDGGPGLEGRSSEWEVVRAKEGGHDDAVGHHGAGGVFPLF